MFIRFLFGYVGRFDCKLEMSRWDSAVNLCPWIYVWWFFSRRLPVKARLEVSINFPVSSMQPWDSFNGKSINSLTITIDITMWTCNQRKANSDNIWKIPYPRITHKARNHTKHSTQIDSNHIKIKITTSYILAESKIQFYYHIHLMYIFVILFLWTQCSARIAI